MSDLPPKLCVVCGSEFHSRGCCPRQEVYCSDVCKNKARWARQRASLGIGSRRSPQAQGQDYTFACGCSGMLPKVGESNLFAVWGGNHTRNQIGGTWACRVTGILLSAKQNARLQGHATLCASHATIRHLMLNVNCVLCGMALKWSIECRNTPHLHHNHKTGLPVGFTHPYCNSIEGKISTETCLRILQDRGYDVTQLQVLAPQAVRVSE